MENKSIVGLFCVSVVGVFTVCGSLLLYSNWFSDLYSRSRTIYEYLMILSSELNSLKICLKQERDLINSKYYSDLEHSQLLVFQNILDEVFENWKDFVFTLDGESRGITTKEENQEENNKSIIHLTFFKNSVSYYKQKELFEDKLIETEVILENILETLEEISKRRDNYKLNHSNLFQTGHFDCILRTNVQISKLHQKMKINIPLIQQCALKSNEIEKEKLRQNIKKQTNINNLLVEEVGEEVGEEEESKGNNTNNKNNKMNVVS